MSVTSPRLINKDPILRLARNLGFSIQAGSNHWIVLHKGGGRTIVPYSKKRSGRKELNIISSLKRAAYAT